MSLELKDNGRLKLTVEADAVLEAEAAANGQHKNEIVREILHAWALRKIHASRILTLRLKREGLVGDDGVMAGNLSGTGHNDQ